MIKRSTKKLSEAIERYILNSVATLIVGGILLTIITIINIGTTQNESFLRLALLIVSALLVIICVVAINLSHRAKETPLYVQRFKNYFEASDTVKNYLLDGFKALDNGQSLTIRVIAVSMHYSWPTLNEILQRYWHPTHTSGHLILEFVITDPTWLKQHDFDVAGNIGTSWANRTQSLLVGIEELITNNVALIIQKKLSVTLSVHEDLPNLHGILINGQYLFESYCEIEEIKDSQNQTTWKLKVGENPYELYYEGTVEHALEKIARFNKLYRYYLRRCESKQEVYINDSIQDYVDFARYLN